MVAAAAVLVAWALMVPRVVVDRNSMIRLHSPNLVARVLMAKVMLVALVLWGVLLAAAAVLELLAVIAVRQIAAAMVETDSRVQFFLILKGMKFIMLVEEVQVQEIVRRQQTLSGMAVQVVVGTAAEVRKPLLVLMVSAAVAAAGV